MSVLNKADQPWVSNLLQELSSLVRAAWFWSLTGMLLCPLPMMVLELISQLRLSWPSRALEASLKVTVTSPTTFPSNSSATRLWRQGLPRKTWSDFCQACNRPICPRERHVAGIPTVSWADLCVQMFDNYLKQTSNLLSQNWKTSKRIHLIKLSLPNQTGLNLKIT